VSTLQEILRPDFLLHDALVSSVLVGAVCPLIGVYFVLRRMIFLGVALPQLSAAGIALAFLLYRVVVGVHAHFEPNERLLAMAGSFGLTLAGLLVLAVLERGGRETIEARIGATYAFASAATLLFLAADPYGEVHMVNLLKGDIVTASEGDLTALTLVFGAVALALFAFRRELLLVSFDREMAIAVGKRVALWDGLLYLLIGVTISFGVMTVGPLVTFGFLVVPPLTARLLTRRMLAFSLVASALGATTAFAGFYCAYRLDLPLGPVDVALACCLLVVVGAIGTARRALMRTRNG
jgi:ABC-type Mn2+/Zn2+ transport system permease subunit